MDIQTNNGYVTITGNFKDCLDFVKSIPDREWVPSMKFWRVPLSTDEFIKLAVQAGVHDTNLAEQVEAEKNAQVHEDASFFDASHAALARAVADVTSGFDTDEATAKMLVDAIANEGIETIDYLEGAGAIIFTDDYKRETLVKIGNQLLEKLDAL